MSNIEQHELKLQYTRPHLYPRQEQAMFDPKRISCIEASTKSGKTASGIIWLGEQALKGRPGRNYWWVAPVSLQAKIAFDRMRRALSQEISTAWLTSPWTIVLINVTTRTGTGTTTNYRILSVSADPHIIDCTGLLQNLSQQCNVGTPAQTENVSELWLSRLLESHAKSFASMHQEIGSESRRRRREKRKCGSCWAFALK